MDASEIPAVTGKAVEDLPPHDYYHGLRLGISDAERSAVRDGRLRDFWLSRLGRDPVARTGIALWGTRQDIETAIEKMPLEYWEPHINPISDIALQFKMPAKIFDELGSTNENRRRCGLRDYWLWIGSSTRQRLLEALREKNGELGPEKERDLMHRLGVSVARAHTAAVDKDAANRIGEIWGLLSQAQIKNYHHAVFAGSGLPASTYGGTPYAWLNDSVELLIAGGLYAHDGDPSAKVNRPSK